MEELIKLVVEKAGISSEQAQSSIETVMSFLKERLPEPMAAQLDGLLSGENAEGLGNVVKGLGGFFGGKK